jgi:hypothetical protein
MIIGLTPRSTARTIMTPRYYDERYFGKKANEDWLNIDPTTDDMSVLGQVPFDSVKLAQKHHTHFLMMVLQMSIMEMRMKCYELFSVSSYEPWYAGDTFANENGEKGWLLLQTNLFDDSLRRPLEMQKALLGESSFLPSARAVVAAMLGHYFATGDWLFKNIMVRTSSKARGETVNVGYIHNHGRTDGIYMDIRSPEGYTHVGMTAAEKGTHGKWLQPV